jgi:hypothetical protein
MGGYEHTFKAEPEDALSVLVGLLGGLCPYAA